MDATHENICNEIYRMLNAPQEKQLPETELRDLVKDSFALVELVISLQQTFDAIIRQEDLEGVRTVGNLAERLYRAAQAQGGGA